MRHVPFDEFRDRLDDFLDAAEAGEDVIVERHGHAAIRLVATQDSPSTPQAELVDRLVTVGDEVLAKGGPTSASERKAWIEDGRL